MKENQPTLRQDIADLWNLGPLPPRKAVQASCHGDRWEERRLWVSEALVGYSGWPHLAQVCRLERLVARRGKTSQEVTYAVTSLGSDRASPKRLLTLWRGHWGIENRLHWVRDVTFDENRCQVRSDDAPHVMTAIRNLTISLLCLAAHPNIAAALRRHAAHPADALALLRITFGYLGITFG